MAAPLGRSGCRSRSTESSRLRTRRTTCISRRSGLRTPPLRLRRPPLRRLQSWLWSCEPSASPLLRCHRRPDSRSGRAAICSAHRVVRKRLSLDRLRRRAERSDLALSRQPLQRLQLDLAHALARDPELSTDLLERFRVGVAVHAVPELDYLLLAVGELLDRVPHRLLAQPEDDLLLDVAGFVRDQLAERGVALFADRLVE